MRILTIVLALSFSLVALADHHEEGKMGEKLPAVKAKMIKNIDARISALEKHKTCVNSAKDKEALKKCRSSMKEFHSGQKEMRQDMHKKMKEKRKNKKGE